MAAALLFVGCGEEPPSPPAEPKARGQAASADRGRRIAGDGERPGGPQSGDGAAQVLHTYYTLIEARRYREAYALREPGRGAASEADFAANFDRYAEYRATIGTPSEPVESGGWDYVEVPVQPYGRMKDGSPIGSAGTVTLRRRAGGGEWRIFTTR